MCSSAVLEFSVRHQVERFNLPPTGIGSEWWVIMGRTRLSQIGVDRQSMLGGRFDQDVANALAVRLCSKSRLAVVARWMTC